MINLILLLPISLFTITTVDCLSGSNGLDTSDFGCFFSDKYYNKKTSWQGKWPGDPLYERTVEPLVFYEKNNEFSKFYTTLKNIVREVYEEYVSNDMDPFLQFYDQYKSTVLPSDSKKSKFAHFYHTYTPSVPFNPPVDNEINATLRVYEKLQQAMPLYNVKNHFIMASYDQDVSSEDVRAYQQYKECPLTTFKHNHIIGAVKISVPGLYKNYIGYVLIDFGHLTPQCPVVMEDADRPENTKEITVGGTRFYSYSMVGRDKTKPFIQINSRKVIKVPYQNPFNSNSGNDRKTSIVYVQKSLCTIVHSIEKLHMLNPMREIVRPNTDGVVIFYCSVKYDDKGGQVHMFKANEKEPWNEEKRSEIKLSLQQIDSMNATQITLMKDISKGLKQNENGLLEKLKRFKDIMTNDSDFVKNIIHWHRVLGIPVHRKPTPGSRPLVELENELAELLPNFNLPM